MWIWLLVALGAVVVLPFLIGSLLPKRYRSSGERVLPASPDDVWRALNDYERHSITGSARRRAEPIDAQGPGPAWREDMGSSVVTVRTVEAELPRRLVRELADSVVPMRARWEYQLDPTPTGTRVTVVEDGVIESGTWHVPIFRLMVRLMKGRGIKAHLDSLEQTFRSRS